MRRVRKRDIRRTRQSIERQRGQLDSSSNVAGGEQPTSSAHPKLAVEQPSPLLSSAEVDRAGEAMASMQMRDRIADLVGDEAKQLEGKFRHEDEVSLLREIEADIRALAPVPAAPNGDLTRLLSFAIVAVEIALDETLGMSNAARAEEIARAALFLPSTLDAGSLR